MAKSHQRRQWLIHPRFQIGFVIYSVTIALIVCAIYFGAIQFFFGELQQLGQAATLPAGHVYFQFLQEQQRSLHRLMIASSITAVALLSIIGILLSHRVVGPLHRLRKHMEATTTGRPPAPISFRKGDFFRDLSQAYNDHLPAAFADQPDDKRET